ncbi:tyrosine-type recombinase/integrase [Methylovulum miyakonense]|uniref:tyrosine-type recombinase/integrase n=1 Tax=Methylovulum miyakonense TaxID=645578 RepID=UPI0038CC151F
MLQMAVFKVNTGCREQKVCSLRWEGKAYPRTGHQCFCHSSPSGEKQDRRVVVLNSEAKSIVENPRGRHSEYVFTYRRDRMLTMNNTAWQKGRKRVGLNHVRIHDLKHTFGHRLRAADVSYEEREDLLGSVDVCRIG